MLALALLFPIALPGAYLTARFATRRIDRIRASLDAITAGQLSERIPVSRHADEYDRLASTTNEMLDALRDVHEGMRQVSADIAHELRSPLARVKITLEELDRHAEDPVRVREGLHAATRDIDHLLALFGELLQIAQVESGSVRAGFQPFDLGEILAELAETYAGIADRDGQHVVLESGGRCEIRAHRALIVQAVVNLIENALRHSARGTTVRLGWSCDAQAARITVRDDGPGIPEAETERVLRRFHRLSQSRDGSGLGLALVAATIRAHGGGIEITRADPGTTVLLTLPRGEVPSGGTPRPGFRSSAPSHPDP